MSRINIEQLNSNLDNNNNGGNMNFRNILSFYLSNDRDGAHVHMLIEDATKVPVYHVHTVQITSKAGKPYYVDVDCIGNGCPFCKEAYANKGGFVGMAKDKLYIPMFVLDRKDSSGVQSVGAVQIFSRPASYYRNDLSPFNMRNGSFENQWIEIERNGVKGDKNVAYRLYTANKDFAGNDLDTKMTIKDFMEEYGYSEDWIFGSVDSIIKSWTVNQMEQVLQTHQYPKGGTSNNNNNVQQDNTPKPRSRTANYGGY